MAPLDLAGDERKRAICFMKRGNSYRGWGKHGEGKKNWRDHARFLRLGARQVAQHLVMIGADFGCE